MALFLHKEVDGESSREGRMRRGVGWCVWGVGGGGTRRATRGGSDKQPSTGREGRLAVVGSTLPLPACPWQSPASAAASAAPCSLTCPTSR